MAGIAEGHKTTRMTRAIAVLGDMLELGEYGVKAHAGKSEKCYPVWVLPI